MTKVAPVDPPPLLIVQVVGVTVTVVLEPEVPLTILNWHFANPKVVAVGKVTATLTDVM